MPYVQHNNVIVFGFLIGYQFHAVIMGGGHKRQCISSFSLHHASFLDSYVINVFDRMDMVTMHVFMLVGLVQCKHLFQVHHLITVVWMFSTEVGHLNQG